MATLFIRLVLLFLVAVNHHQVLGSPIASVHARSVAAPSHPRRSVNFRPVHPSTRYSYENRDQTHNGVGDFVMHGLGGLMKMVSKEYGLRRSESFFWGPAGNPLANLTAYVDGQDVKVLSMERFQDVLDNAKCSDNSIQFKFKKEVAFDLVQKEWKWINDADSNYVVLVTENARCNAPDGDHTNRQPWHIKTAAFNDATNTVTLTAEPKTWEDAFSHWHLKVDSKGLVPRHRLAKRIGWENETFSLPLAASLPPLPLEFTGDDDEIAASVTCSSCYTTGSLDFLVDVDWDLLDGVSGTITMTPNDLAAYVTVDVSVEKEFGDGVGLTKEIFSYVPFGINIPLIATIGPAFKVDLIAGLESNAQVDLTSGANMTIPADANAVLDFSDSSKNEFFDWTPTFTPNPPTNDLDGEVSITAYAGVMLRAEFDLQILTYGFSAGLALKAPMLDFTIAAVGDMSGDVCDVAGADFGVDMDLALGVELDGFAGFGAATDLPGEMTIFATSWPLFSTCMPVASGLPQFPGSSALAIPSAISSAASGNSSHFAQSSSAAVATSSSSYAHHSSSAGRISSSSPRSSWSSSNWPSSTGFPASSSAAAASSYIGSATSAAVAYSSTQTSSSSWAG